MTSCNDVEYHGLPQQDEEIWKAWRKDRDTDTQIVYE
jgi:hypothetical protein